MRMVVVASASTRFEADLYAAKLGAHGVLWEIRSRELVPTTHPIGWLEVLVPAEEAEEAAEVLSIDEGGVADGQSPRARLSPAVRTMRWALGAALAVPIAVTVAAWATNALRLLDVVR
jgi:hypothetical protein